MRAAVVRGREEDPAVEGRAEAAAGSAGVLDQIDVLRRGAGVIDSPGDVGLARGVRRALVRERGRTRQAPLDQSVDDAVAVRGNGPPARPVVCDDGGAERRVGVDGDRGALLDAAARERDLLGRQGSGAERRSRQEQRGSCPDDQQEQVRSESRQGREARRVGCSPRLGQT